MGWLGDIYDYGKDLLSGNLGGPTSLDWANYEQTKLANQQNYEAMQRTFGLQSEAFGLQKAQANWQREAQEKTWAREDTAVQRRANDLTSAGINPLLAAGSPASASSPVSPVMPSAPSASPRKDVALLPTKVPQISSVLNLIQQKADIDRTKASTLVEQAQASKSQAEADFLTKANPSRITSVEQEAIVAKATSAFKVEQMRQIVESVGLDNARKWIDNQIQDVGLDQARVDLVLKQIQQKQGYLGLTKTEQEIVSKAIAIQIQETENKQKSHDFTFWEMMSLPSNGGLDPASRLLGGTRMDNNKRYHDGTR